MLGKSDKIRDTGLIWDVGHDNFLEREEEMHFQNLPQRLMKTKKWQINLFSDKKIHTSGWMLSGLCPMDL